MRTNSFRTSSNILDISHSLHGLICKLLIVTVPESYMFLDPPIRSWTSSTDRTNRGFRLCIMLQLHSFVWGIWCRAAWTTSILINKLTNQLESSYWWQPQQPKNIQVPRVETSSKAIKPLWFPNQLIVINYCYHPWIQRSVLKRTKKLKKHSDFYQDRIIKIQF